MRRVLVLQPYVPEYRVPLFDYLRKGFPDIGFEFHVAAGRPDADQEVRGDASPSLDYAHQLSQLDFTMGSWRVQYKRVQGLLKNLRPDMVIIEQAIKNLESWPLLLASSSHKPLVGVWGQGGFYSYAPDPLSRRIKLLMNQRSRWLFTYTSPGAEFVVKQGFPRDRVTVLNNSTDTAELRSDLRGVSSAQLDHLRTRYGLVRGKTALFIGGVDSRKGIEFLMEAARVIGTADPQFKLLVAGEGGDVCRVKEAQANGSPVQHVGRVRGLAKAEMLALCDFLMIPEWVGLVATDALAAGRPVMTTDHPSHAPEISYLVDGSHRLTTPHDVERYAASTVELMRDQVRLSKMQDLSLKAGASYSIESMGERFIDGVGKWAHRDLTPV